MSQEWKNSVESYANMFAAGLYGGGVLTEAVMDIATNIPVNGNLLAATVLAFAVKAQDAVHVVSMPMATAKAAKVNVEAMLAQAIIPGAQIAPRMLNVWRKGKSYITVHNPA